MKVKKLQDLLDKLPGNKEREEILKKEYPALAFEWFQTTRNDKAAMTFNEEKTEITRNDEKDLMTRIGKAAEEYMQECYQYKDDWRRYSLYVHGY